LGEEEGFGEGEEAAGEAEESDAGEGEGERDDFGFAGDVVGLAEGVGDGWASGFTGPVGCSAEEVVGLVEDFGVGEGEGEGAAWAPVHARNSAKARTAQGDLMATRWIDRSVGRGRDALRREHSHRARDCSIHQAATLDDALRVAKNFRMSDHRQARQRAFFL